MPRKKVLGTCHICGAQGPLTFEHVPPRRAFNDEPVVAVPIMQALDAGLDEELAGTLIQRGMGWHSLCESCNTKTGHWYGGAFVKWTYQGMKILKMSDFRPKLIYLHHILPLRVLKQITTMFFSVCSPNFRQKHDELVKFVLNPEWRYIPPKYRFFAYFNVEGRPRTIGNTMTHLRLGQGVFRMCEVAFPPYGYVMTLDCEPPDKRLVEITHFKRFSYNEFETVPLHLPVLPTYLPLPGDYRTREEIIETEERDRAVEEAVRRSSA